MGSTSGSLNFHCQGAYYTLRFPDRGWLAVELLRFLDEVLLAPEAPVGILKLLGLTVEISSDPPSRDAAHWVEVDLDSRKLASNSPYVRQAVRKKPPNPEDPVTPTTLQRIFEILDRFDFTVELYRS